MQPSRNTSIRAVPPLPKLIDTCVAQPGIYREPSSPTAQRPEAQKPEAQKSEAQLQQALSFEILLRQIIERLHSSLDPDQVLQTVVRELAVGLNVKGCNLALYDLKAGSSTLRYECLRSEIPVPLDQTVQLDSLHLYQQLLQRQSAQFCRLELHRGRPTRSQMVCLACPIQDAEAVLGDLWLFKPRTQSFSPAELRLVQQVAEQCAIALRQAQLHQQTQAQVEALEQLHQRKDDFLSTVSHELRTPMSNIKMAVQLLEMNLEQIDPAQFAPLQRYLKILKDETAHEITLINDLLDLSRLEAGIDPLVISTTNPVFWLPPIIEPFAERAKLQQQQFQIDLATYLPPLTTDLGNLERILSELLNNACKYTPAEERIIFSARLLKASAAVRPPVFLFSVTNSGIEIPAAEQSRIFDKFYRISGHDRWQQGGTGLGLSLAKGLVERLAGQLRVESYAGLTRFTVELPSRPPDEP
ncbi:GAF domain-containing sensor histidine kinase [Rivularia sp. UHCC 0363]|uniref:GAF domain-containing sensor histidine kinase n=1 Tax=Rivularia sp. UHCC 0363 TaxID=3110244 RepID=UPI002B21D70E|nr:GAF domain-containing sensor histidine kinase [Rivularia sp. UHCC 0363]MEA5597464.1 GAF domain-containing sensor histidine kinase [Rivularia sp. UHCC 0363]